jgi:serine/threonine protein kinase
MAEVADVSSLIGAIGPYNLLEALPESGPGRLYRARDTKHGRTVGVRVLPADFARTPAERQAFIESARELVRMSHPNVTTLFDLGEHEEHIFLVFEFLVGQPLRAEMVGKHVRLRRALELAIQIADAVGTAHSLGFSHRGLSPESIVVTSRGHAKIPAFDLAVRDGFEPGAGGGRLRDYEAPEETNGHPPDDRSDVYSVGAILYEMLTARRPHPRGADAPSASNPHITADVDQVVLKAVAPNPDSRYESAAELAAALRKCLAALDAKGGSADDEDAAPAEGSGVGQKFALAAAAGVALGVAIFWWFMRS